MYFFVDYRGKFTSISKATSSDKMILNVESGLI